MSELHLADILVEVLGYRLLGILILICNAQCDHRRHGYHETGIDPESRVEAMDQGNRCLLAMAAEHSATELSAELALMLVNPLVVLP